MKIRHFCTGMIVILTMVVIVGFIDGKTMPEEYTPNSEAYKIFAQIEELDVLESYIVDKSEDLKIVELEPIEQYSYNIRFKEKLFTVRGYRFCSEEEALQYFRRVFNKSSRTIYLMRGDTQQYGAWLGTDVLYISGKGNPADTADFINWLSQYLSFDVKEENLRRIKERYQIT